MRRSNVSSGLIRSAAVARGDDLDFDYFFHNARRKYRLRAALPSETVPGFDYVLVRHLEDGKDMTLEKVNVNLAATPFNVARPRDDDTSLEFLWLIAKGELNDQPVR